MDQMAFKKIIIIFVVTQKGIKLEELRNLVVIS